MCLDSGLWTLHAHATRLLALDWDSPSFREQQQQMLGAYFNGVRSGFSSQMTGNSSTQGQGLTPGRGNWSVEDLGYYHKCVHLVIHSLYIIPIYHWHHQFNSQLLLVSAELLQASTLPGRGRGEEETRRAVLKRWDYIFKFLGVHALDSDRRISGDVHEGDKQGRSRVRMDNATTTRLKYFLQPFQSLLYQFLERNYSHNQADLVIKYEL